MYQSLEKLAVRFARSPHQKSSILYNIFISLIAPLIYPNHPLIVQIFSKSFWRGMGPLASRLNHAMKHTLIAHIYRGLKRFSSRNSRVHIPGDEFRLAIWIISQLLRDRLVQPPTSSPALLSRNIHENRAFYPVIVRIVSNHIFQHVELFSFQG